MTKIEQYVYTENEVNVMRDALRSAYKDVDKLSNILGNTDTEERIQTRVDCMKDKMYRLVRLM